MPAQNSHTMKNNFTAQKKICQDVGLQAYNCVTESAACLGAPTRCLHFTTGECWARGRDGGLLNCCEQQQTTVLIVVLIKPNFQKSPKNSAHEHIWDLDILRDKTSLSAKSKQLQRNIAHCILSASYV